MRDESGRARASSSVENVTTQPTGHTPNMCRAPRAQVPSASALRAQLSQRRAHKTLKDVLVSIFWHGPLCLSGVLSVFFRGQLRVGAVRWAGAS